MAKRNQGSSSEGNKPTHDCFAVVRRRVRKEGAADEIEEVLADLGPGWPTENGHIRVRMYTVPLEWLDTRVTERTLLVVKRGDRG